MDASRSLELPPIPPPTLTVRRWEVIPSWFLTKDGYWLYARLIRSEDAPRLLEMFEYLSPQTRWRRFHTNVDHINDEAKAYHAYQFATVDNVRTGGAVVAVDHQGAGEKIVGVLRLGAPEDGRAEVAVVVRDDFQQRGVGRALLQRLPTLARRMGVHTVTGTIQADNFAALRLFRRSHLPMTTHTSRAEAQFQITVPPAINPSPASLSPDLSSPASSFSTSSSSSSP